MTYLKNNFALLLAILLLALPAQAAWFGLSFHDRQEFVNARNTYNAGHYEQAIKELSAYIYKTENIKRREARAYRLLGLSYEHLNRPGKALEVYQEALEFHQKNIPLLLAAAALYQRTDLIDKSIEMYNRVLALEPDNEEALAGQAYNYLEMGFYSKSREYYDQFFALNSYAPDIHRARYAYACLKQRAYEDALINIVMALTENPNNAEYWLTSARAYKGLGRMSDALADLDIAISLAPEQLENQAIKSMWLYQQKDFQASLAQAENLLKQDPSDELALFMIYMNLKDKSPQKARHALQKIHAQDTGSFAEKVADKLLK